VGTNESGVPLPLSGAYALLEPGVAALLREVLGQWDPELDSRLADKADVSKKDVEEVERILYHEFVQHLGEDWEPTSYGKAVDNAIGAFVTKFLIEREH
jgi:hypothetical protein